MSAERKHNLIVVPGFGDNEPGRLKFHRNATSRWRAKGIEAEVHPVGWHEDIDFLNALDILDDKVAHLLKGRNPVSLLGTSMAGTMVLNAFMEHPDEVHSVIPVCAYLSSKPYRGYRSLGVFGLQSSMAIDSVRWFEEHEQEFLTPAMRDRIMTVTAPDDPLIAAQASKLDGAFNVQTRTVVSSHREAVSRAMTTESGVIVDFLNRKAV